MTTAVADYNPKKITGPVVFSLLGSVNTTGPENTGEVFPIVINANSGSSATNTLTIKPAVGVSPTISGSAGGALIKLNGADYVTIDGSNTPGGTTRDLTITNTSTNAGTAAIWLARQGAGAGAAYTY